MEGLIPLVYKAIVQYRNGGQNGMIGTWLDESTQSPAYMRLPGDSGRFATASGIQILRQDHGFAACSPPRSGSAAERAASAAGGQHHLISSRRAVK